MKKLLAVTLFAMIYVANTLTAQIAWDGTATTWTNGSGTASDPYLIETPQHLAWISYMVNNGITTYSGVYFKQTEEFDMNGSSYQFNVIGSNSNGGTYFAGNYDGSFKNIHNLVISSTSSYVGLFGYTSRSTLKRICIRGILGNSTSGKDYGGAICGYADGDSIIQCSCIGGVICNYNYRLGGLVGYAANTYFENCFMKGDVTETDCSGNKVYMGGLIGIADLTSRSGLPDLSINACYFIGRIVASSTKSGAQVYDGLIMSYSTGRPLRMSNSYAVAGFHIYSNCQSIRDDSMSGHYGYYSSDNLIGGHNLICQTSGVLSSRYATQKTDVYMKSTVCLNDLNAGYTNGPYFYDMDTVNEGYPIFDYQRIVRYHTITANYDATKGRVTGGGMHAENSIVSLRAMPVEGYVFSGWSDGSTENPRSVTVSSDATYTAVFSKNAYNIYIKQDCTVDVE